MHAAMTGLWRQVHEAPTFESAIDALSADLAAHFVPTPLRAVAVLRSGDIIRAVHTAPLADRRSLDGVAACAAWRSVGSGHRPLLLNVSPVRSDAHDALHASQDTREGLLQRSTQYIVTSPLFAGRGLVAWEFAEAPTEWQAPAEVACLLSPWFPTIEVLQPPGPYTDGFLPVAGATLSRVLHLLERFARQDEPILLYGETGVGKTRLVQWLHARSRRAGHPLEVVNLLTVEENLRAARLFGTRRGAFTGAVDTPGAVFRADGGTLFIDEIDKLPLSTQGQLLQLLDDGSFQPLGAEKVRRSNVRIVTGTNADLRSRVAKGLFLHDLYQRIAVLPLRVPPLRERPEDIAPWASWFLGEQARKTGEHRLLGNDAAMRLRSLPWPGNLRQLAGLMARIGALDLEHAEINAADVDRALAMDPESSPPLREALMVAASAFLDVAEARPEVKLDHIRALRGLVLRFAVDRHGKRDAFRVLGEAHRLDGDNHHRVLKEEAEHVERLWRLLGQGPESSDG